MNQVAHHAGAYLCFQYNLKQKVTCLLPSGWDTSPLPGLPLSIKFANTFSYT